MHAKQKPQRVMITAALPYVNNVPHIGNIVGSHLPADIFARYCRLRGHETLFVGGTDEHGTPIELEAQKLGISSKELVDFYHKIHKDIYEWFNISYDNFSRTSLPAHHETVQQFFLEMWKNKFVLEKEMSIPFCKHDRRALPDRYIEGTCPVCKNPNAKGDQCEKCGTLLDPTDLKNPRCAICGNRSIEFRKSKHLFLDLPKLSKKLEVWIRSNKHWRPQVSSMALGWIKQGLKERCITRDLKWGVKVPLKGYEDKVFYVWFDAPIGYISSTKEWASKTNKPNEWKKYWEKESDAKLFHVVGKDNIPFHSIFWPASLMANGRYKLPHNVIGLQYLNYEGDKISKSKKHGIFCENLANAGLDADYWRFYLTFLIPEKADTEFLWTEFEERINKDLVGNFANFINRIATFVWNFYNGGVPKPSRFNKVDQRVLSELKNLAGKYDEALWSTKFREALEILLKISDLGNKYFQESEPWRLVKDDKDRAATIVYVCANLCRTLSLLVSPYLPNTTTKINQMFNFSMDSFDSALDLKVKPGHEINEPKILFAKLDEFTINEIKPKVTKVTDFFRKEKEVEVSAVVSGEQVIPFKSWEKFDFRIGIITNVKDHPNADKLYVITVSIGKTTKQVVAGLKKFYTKEQLKGKKVVIFNNLEPVMLRGVQSQGMLLAAEDEKGTVALLTPEKDVLSGAKVR